VYLEPVSALNSLREKYREFRKTWLPAAPEVPNSVDAIAAFDPIPRVPEQGILKREQGRKSSEKGI
jgi:hypothetical protein